MVELRKRDKMSAVIIYIVMLLICVPVFRISAQDGPYNTMVRVDWDRIDTLDTAFLRVSYRMRFPSDTYIDSTNTDIRIVEVGTSFQKDYSQIIETAEFLARTTRDSGRNFSSGTGGTAIPLDLFISEDSVTETYKTMVMGPILKWTELKENQEWSLLPETISILGYTCQKAETEFRGRTYTAWFTSQIPVDAGPYKFRGLPGLILKVEDGTGTYLWQAEGIERGSWPIYMKRYLYQECSRKEGLKYIELMFKDTDKWMAGRGLTTYQYDPITKQLRESTAEEKESYYYDPIEMEE